MTSWFLINILLATVTIIVSGQKIISITEFQTSTCSGEGFICMTCRTAAQCLFINGEWRPQPFEDCDEDNGFYCNVLERGCSQNVGACSPGQEGSFVCNTEGVFPNPFDCQRYHLCRQEQQNMVSINMVCDTMAFSAATGDCSLHRNDTICTTLQWSCSRAGEMNSWPGNNNIYYLCIVDTQSRALYPQLYRCSGDQIFNDGRCMDRQGVSSTTPPDEDNSYRCESAGLFPDPIDCRFYYFCDINLNSQHLQCPAGTIFQSSTASCVVGTC
ncbi:uncharacterized protein LOC129725785 [Wyeomyia smithii]|uniref:uncharacterized protein LOC129725785 n=1 Tax=Wyeomyia smithii TaxID=174621 RepID=UPI002467F095|nr:uncharacterized protein LOC129725785 [Wyeomyia smithii]